MDRSVEIFVAAESPAGPLKDGASDPCRMAVHCRRGALEVFFTELPVI